jgi:hypothetical protein
MNFDYVQRGGLAHYVFPPHSTAAVVRSRAWQSETGYEPTDCDRYDYHQQRLVLTDLDVRHCEVLGETIIVTHETHRETPRRR